MCGIAGLWQRDGASREGLARSVEDMTGALSHRGPDDFGVWINSEAGIALGHRRLSIIDLSPAGHQPMLSSDRRFVITYNGECYNFADLRNDLVARGAMFRGQSDTEVIIEGCVRWGVKETVSRLNGMFALAIWDVHERRLYLARDRMGEKPLYWAVFGSLVLFGSELKALRAVPSWHPRLNRGAVAAFLRHNYVPGPFTIYEGVNKLPPGRFVSIGARSVQEDAYWSLEEAVTHGPQRSAHRRRRGVDRKSRRAAAGCSRAPDGLGCSARGVSVRRLRFVERCSADAKILCSAGQNLHDQLRPCDVR